ncbi:MAG TPA: NCS2 family permease [Bacillota bacterium]
MSEQSRAASPGWLERYFAISRVGSSVGTELVAGLTTFMTMAYILFVNPNILAATGMDPQAVLMATALSAGFASILMGLLARLPFALAPGMGLNAYFAFTVVLGMGIPWQVVLGAVFIDGLIFLVISLLPIRERIIQEIPLNLKLATSVAIGLFIAFIGLTQAGLVIASDATLVTLGNLTAPGTLVSVFGLVLTGVLLARRVRGALIWGILAATVVAMFVRVPTEDGGTRTLATIPSSIGDIIAFPDWAVLANTFGQLQIGEALALGIVAIIFTFTFVDMFDTAGTFIGLATKLGMVDEKGSFPGAGRGLIADATATMFGAVMGTSTVTTYIESAAGVAAGGRTGLTAVVTGVLFLLAAFLSPLALIIPGQATAPALIIVGLLMAEPIKRINLEDYTEALPAFLTLIMMPLTYSIANGLIFGILSYVVFKLISGRWTEVKPTMWVLAVLFVFYLGYGQL